MTTKLNIKGTKIYVRCPLDGTPETQLPLTTPTHQLTTLLASIDRTKLE